MQVPALTQISPQLLTASLEPKKDGRVSGVVGLLIRGHCPGAKVGDMVHIDQHLGQSRVGAQIIGISRGELLMVPLGDAQGIGIGAKITHQGHRASLACCESMLGRILDAQGRPMDLEKGPLTGPMQELPLYRDAPCPLTRPLIEKPLETGIRALDGLLTLGQGQRVGVMAGAGVGKSTLMGWLAQQAKAEVIVVGLIGERGREVQEFLCKTLSPEARKRCVMVAVTSDRSALERSRGAFVATTVAEYFASRGQQVLLMMDSLTRFAMAQREMGLSMGEPPATRGYTPSVFAQLPKLLERSGRLGRGSITGIYTILVEGDDLNDPIGDAARSILDGHIVLSRELAQQGHFPAIDALASVSRVMDAVAGPAHSGHARRFRKLLALQKEAHELSQIGALVQGQDPLLDLAHERRRACAAFLQQKPGEHTPINRCVEVMSQLAQGVQ